MRLTVAAAPFNNPTVPETFSSLGGHVQIFSDDNGNRFDTPTFVQKPNVMAPDGVQVSFELDGQPAFFGTSAATPHAAAAAALLESQNHLVNNVEIDRYLEITTESPLVPGFNAESGHGLIQLQPLVYSPGIYEPDGTADASFNLGDVGTNKMIITSEIGDNSQGFTDFDWYVVTASQTAAVNVVMDNPNLQVNVFAFSPDPLGQVVPGFLTQVANGSIFNAGSLVYIEVLGQPITSDTFTTGVYNLGIELN